MDGKFLLSTALLGCLGGTAARAADLGSNTTLGAQIFVDFSSINQTSNGVDTGATGKGFDAKRAYLIVDHKVDDVWSANLTTDAQYSSSSGGVAEVFIKKLYLQARLNDALVVHAGSYTTPWIGLVEPAYGLRWIDKTIMDRLGYLNTADWGLNAEGKFLDGRVSYSASILNGAGFKNPSRSKDVDFEGRVGVNPTAWLTLGAGYLTGHLGQVTQANSSFPTHAATRETLLANVKYQGLNVSVEYFNAKNYKAYSATTGAAAAASTIVGINATTAPLTDEASGVSTSASYKINAQYLVFARYDQARPSKDIHSSLKSTYFNFGIAYKASRNADLALVYKNDKVENGLLSVSGGNAGASNAVGGTGVAPTGPVTGGKLSEIGIYAQYKF